MSTIMEQAILTWKTECGFVQQYNPETGGYETISCVKSKATDKCQRCIAKYGYAICCPFPNNHATNKQVIL